MNTENDSSQYEGKESVLLEESHTIATHAGRLSDTKSTQSVSTQLLSGGLYSKILVARTVQYLKRSNGGLDVTHKEVGDELDVSRQMVSGVLSGDRTFGKKFFQKRAEIDGVSLRAYLVGLARWERQNSTQESNLQAPLWDNTLPSLESCRIRLTARLRRWLLGRRVPATEAGRHYSADRIVNGVLREFSELLGAASLDGTPELSLLLIGKTPGSDQEEQACRLFASNAEHGNESDVDTENNVSAEMNRASATLWRSIAESSADEDESPIRPLWLQEPRKASVKNHNPTFHVCAPCYFNTFDSSHDRPLTTLQASLHAKLMVDNSNEATRNFIADAITLCSQLIEYVLLAATGDVWSAVRTGVSPIDEAAQLLTSNCTAPRIEHVETACTEWMEHVVTSRRRGKKASAKVLRELLAVDVWAYDSWNREFYYRQGMNMHLLTARSGRVKIVDTSSGGEVAFSSYYKKHLSSLRPRAESGKSIDCISKRRPVAFNSMSRDVLWAEAQAMLSGTTIGLPVLVCGSPDTPVVAWFRFGRDLNRDEIIDVTANLRSTMSSRKRYGGLILEPMFVKPSRKSVDIQDAIPESQPEMPNSDGKDGQAEKKRRDARKKSTGGQKQRDCHPASAT